jgi:hypothetical protein
MSVFRSGLSLLAAVSLAGCGTRVPDMQLFDHSEDAEGNAENVIVTNVVCELRLGVAKALHDFDMAGGRHNDVSWLAGWGATVTLKITVDEKGAFNPSLTPNVVFPNAVSTFSHGGNVTTGQGFTLPIGIATSADATRVETIAFTYSFKDLLAQETEIEKNYPNAHDCSENEHGQFIDSDLKIGDFIHDKMYVASVPGTTNPAGKASPYSVFNYEVTFVASFGGVGTPTWKFLRVSVDPTAPLLSASRQKTDDLVITLGKTTPATKTSPAKISPEAQSVHISIVNAIFVGSSIQSQQH